MSYAQSRFQLCHFFSANLLDIHLNPANPSLMRQSPLLLQKIYSSILQLANCDNRKAARTVCGNSSSPSFSFLSKNEEVLHISIKLCQENQKRDKERAAGAQRLTFCWDCFCSKVAMFERLFAI